MSDQTDTEYYEGIILSVDPGDDGWGVEFRDIDRPEETFGPSCWVPDKGIEPHAGDTIRFWGKGLFRPFRGIAINGQTVFYRTEAEQNAQWEQETREREREQREAFERGREDFDRRVSALPELFQDRMAGFYRRNPEFGWRYGQYELSCCEDAVRIADTLKTPEAISKWWALDWDAQQAAVPGLFDGHSGNSFAAAARFADIYLTESHLIPEMHGALCPLVGCRDYGCWALEAESHD